MIQCSYFVKAQVKYDGWNKFGEGAEITFPIFIGDYFNMVTKDFSFSP